MPLTSWDGLKKNKTKEAIHFATFNEIATQINLLSMDDKMPTMNLNKWSLQRWFKKNKGKEKRPVF